MDRIFIKKGRASLYILAILSGITFAWVYLFFKLQAAPQTPAGADFIIFYTAAKMVVTGAASKIYNMDAVSVFQQGITHPYRKNILLPYNHPPFQIIAYLPLTIMPLRWAYRVWAAISLGIMTASLMALKSYLKPASGREQAIMWLACFSFFPIVATLLQGQDSAISLLIFTLVFLCLKGGKEGRAGLILAFGLFKPQLTGIAVIILLFKRRWKALGCFCLAALVLIVLSLFIVGWQGGLDYLNLILKVATLEVAASEGQYGVFPSAMHNIKAFFLLIFSSDQRQFLMPALILTTSGLLILLFLSWKGKWQPSSHLFDLKFSVLILVTLLISPHLYIHDLILLIIPGILLAGYLKREIPEIKGCLLKALLPLGYMAALFSFLYSRSVHIQIGAVFMAAAVILLACEIFPVERKKMAVIASGDGDGRSLT